MENLVIEGTKSSPKIKFNADTNILHIEGESYMENAPEFYKPVFEWLEKFLEITTKPVDVNLRLEYFNTSSTKMFLTFFEILEEAVEEKEKDITVNWYYNSDNEIALEYAEDFKEDLELTFNIIEL